MTWRIRISPLNHYTVTADRVERVERVEDERGREPKEACVEAVVLAQRAADTPHAHCGRRRRGGRASFDGRQCPLHPSGEATGSFRATSSLVRAFDGPAARVRRL